MVNVKSEICCQFERAIIKSLIFLLMPVQRESTKFSYLKIKVNKLLYYIFLSFPCKTLLYWAQNLTLNTVKAYLVISCTLDFVLFIKHLRLLFILESSEWCSGMQLYIGTMGSTPLGSNFFSSWVDFVTTCNQVHGEGTV